MIRRTLGFICVTLFLLIADSAKADFLIQPYLYSILGNQIGVSWKYAPTDLPAQNPSLALYQGGVLIQTLPATLDSDLFSVVLPTAPCGFGSDLTYQVDGQLAPVPIIEVPCANFTGAVKFSFLADSQEGTAYDKRFADLLAMFPGAGILHGGDIVQTGDSESDWEGYFNSMQSVGGSRILFPSLGNHEYREGAGTELPFWFHFFKTEAHDEHYAFDMGAARIIVLNSNFESDPSLKLGQLAWLESELQIPSQWKIIYYHHPGFSVGFFNSPLAPRKEWVTIQDEYIPLFEKYKVDLVMNGHVHIFETAEKSGVHYLTVGPAGGKMGVYGGHDPYKIKMDLIRSIINLEVAPDHLRALSTAINGEILDDLLLTK